METDQAVSHLGAAELARRIADGSLTSREAVESCLDRIRRFNGEINAVILLREEEARRRADQADRARREGASWGPLHGVPMTVKECFDWTGTPSTFGHPERREHRAEQDAVALARLTQAGAIVLGKTNVPKDLSDWQSFNAVYGVTRNPWNLERSPGGSSGGAAAALAAGFCALEIGSDVGGSIRMPAHFCGVYGHRPTFGIVPVRGHATVPHAPPDDLLAVGPLARTVEDLELALRLMAGPDGAAARAWRLELPAAPTRQYRVAVMTGDAEFPVDADTRRAALAVADALRENGNVTLDPGLPIPSREYYELYIALLRGSTSFRRSVKEIETLGKHSKDGYEGLMLRGLTQTHREWLERNAERHRLRLRWEEFFQRYDALITPVSPTPAFPHVFDLPKQEQRLMVDGKARPMADTYFWIGIAATAGLPVTTIPAGRSESGLPIGLQVIGPEYGDLTCLALARRLESAHRGFQVPPL